MVNGKPLWDYMKESGLSKTEVLKDNVFLITILFDARVKSMIKNILMGKGKDKVPISYYSYRVEFQARGMPHVHGKYYETICV